MADYEIAKHKSRNWLIMKLPSIKQENDDCDIAKHIAREWLIMKLPSINQEIG